MATTQAPPTTTTTPSKSYTFSRGAASATRALVDSSNPSPQTASGTQTPSDPTAPHATLHRRKTNNYESALADRLNASLAETGSNLVNKDPDPSHNITGLTSTSTTMSPATTGISSRGTGPTISSGLAYRGDEAAAKRIPEPQQTYTSQYSSPLDTASAAAASRPGLAGEGMLGRQQSWKQTDQKRAVMQRMLGTESGGDRHRAGGYTSGQPTPSGA